MAIHIKELNISLHLGESGHAKSPNESDANKLNNSSCENSKTINHAAVVQDTITEVMRILKEKNER
jgi:hypothetical protein